jgi:hypothetical protein
MLHYIKFETTARGYWAHIKLELLTLICNFLSAKVGRLSATYSVSDDTDTYDYTELSFLKLLIVCVCVVSGVYAL